MRARSWMAALALIVGTLIAVGRAVPALVSSPAQDQGQAQDATQAEPRSQTTSPKPPDSRIPAVQLDLVIAGLSREGCDVEVKPGNASCKFRALNERGAEGRQHVSSAGRAKLQLRDVELRGADRTCTVAITVREPGQTVKTIYRGFRLASRSDAAGSSTTTAVPIFTCYLSSPSKLAKVDDSRSRK
jgi:hypothetical protein